MTATDAASPENRPLTRARVAIIGVRGYGARHLRAIAEACEHGTATFVAGCDLSEAAAQQLPDEVTFSTDHRAMLAAASPDITVIATPPHTHAALAADAIVAGSDVLMEKPPVASLAEHRRLLELADAHGRACQVGFQTLAAPALTHVLDAVRAGRVGTVTDIVATGAWIRTDGYYRRTDWAGRRRLGTTVVPDGAATNPFAHAVMNAFAVAEVVTPGATPDRLHVEAYRCRAIEADDTVSARMRVGDLTVTLAFTLCAEEFEAPCITVRGTGGEAILRYTENAVRLPGDTHDVRTPPGPSLLTNLIEHRTEPGTPLVAPLSRTAPFTGFLEAHLAAGEPHLIPEAFRTETRGDDGERRVVLAGVNEAIERSRVQSALFSELGLPWTTEPVAVGVPPIR